MSKMLLALKAVRELGLTQVGLYGLYRLGGWIGLWRLLTPPPKEQAPGVYRLRPIGSLPDAQDLRVVLGPAVTNLLAEADQICKGKVRLFGGGYVSLDLAPPLADRHWSRADDPGLSGDIKWIWEPARFGWAFRLAEAAHLTGDRRYAEAFWRHFTEFSEKNPPYFGPNWASAQEAGIRILALAFAASVLPLDSEQCDRLAVAIADHARRIPPTLLYARAQHNNHLLTEAAGLLTAGCVLEGPEADRWRALGWWWLNRGLQAQIDDDGVYAQHSTNYHRLMLHAALWCDALIRKNGGLQWPVETKRKLAAATRWLAAQVDPISGDAPNLGHNDGSRILPFFSIEFRDYRPVVQAAARAFLGKPALPPGSWDALCLWLGLPAEYDGEGAVRPSSPGVYRLGDENCWATLRAARFTSRPAHADQLHVDLWWQGQNVLLDPGTFQYNAPPPWQNALSGTAVHNSVTVHGADQMTPAGRFLWLDWAQARIVASESEAGQRWTAEHDGYRRLGIVHRRTLERTGPNLWLVLDSLRSADGSGERRVDEAVLHWLLPDGDWHLEGSILQVQTPAGRLQLAVEMAPGVQLDWVQVVRAGKALFGREPQSPVFGWYSPTYGIRLPALAFRLAFSGRLPLDWRTVISTVQG